MRADITTVDGEPVSTARATIVVRGEAVTSRKFADVAVGDELPPLTVTVTRADLVRYAGASLDFNPIHWNQSTSPRQSGCRT